jgi:hypothetical protein
MFSDNREYFISDILLKLDEDVKNNLI